MYFSAENYLDLVNAALANGNYAALDSLAVESHRLNALANVVGVLDSDVVCCAAELSCSLEAVPLVRNGRINAETVEIRLYAEDILGNSHHIPCSSTCEP